MLAYKRHLKPKARDLRKKMTDSEMKLWSKLRRKQVLEVQFYRQKPLGPYIVDFYAPRANLVIEVDGSQHCLPQAQGYEQERNRYLQKQGLTVLHFNSREVLMEIDDVMKVIFEKVSEQLNPP
jgi:very-short-patch-repair endonuclease